MSLYPSNDEWDEWDRQRRDTAGGFEKLEGLWPLSS